MVAWVWLGRREDRHRPWEEEEEVRRSICGYLWRRRSGTMTWCWVFGCRPVGVTRCRTRCRRYCATMWRVWWFILCPVGSGVGMCTSWKAISSFPTVSLLPCFFQIDLGFFGGDLNSSAYKAFFKKKRGGVGWDGLFWCWGKGGWASCCAEVWGSWFFDIGSGYILIC